jgi:hypothetical protein
MGKQTHTVEPLQHDKGGKGTRSKGSRDHSGRRNDTEPQCSYGCFAQYEQNLSPLP